jgi:hypothetical protein
MTTDLTGRVTRPPPAWEFTLTLVSLNDTTLVFFSTSSSFSQINKSLDRGSLFKFYQFRRNTSLVLMYTFESQLRPKVY